MGVARATGSANRRGSCWRPCVGQGREATPNSIIAGTPFSFEIDEAGLGVWTLWEHANNLQCPANEDDNQPLTQGLQDLAAQAIDPIMRPPWWRLAVAREDGKGTGSKKP